MKICLLTLLLIFNTSVNAQTKDDLASKFLQSRIEAIDLYSSKINYSVFSSAVDKVFCGEGDLNCIYSTTSTLNICGEKIFAIAKNIEEKLDDKDDFMNFIFNASQLNLFGSCGMYLTYPLEAVRNEEKGNLYRESKNSTITIKNVISLANEKSKKVISENTLTKEEIVSLVQRTFSKNQALLNDYFCIKYFKPFQKAKNPVNYTKCIDKIDGLFAKIEDYECYLADYSADFKFGEISKLTHKQKIEKLTEYNWFASKGHALCYWQRISKI